MRKQDVLLVVGCVLLSLLLSPGTPAQSVEQTGLSVRKGPGPGQVTLEWSGGFTPYAVFRGTDPATVANAANQITSTDGSLFIDSPPSAARLYYVVAGPTLLSIEVAPFSSRLPSGFEQRFTATGVLSDGSSRDLTDRVVWSSSAPSIASVSNAAGARGVVTGAAPGATQIGAQLYGVAGSTQLTVTDAHLDSVLLSPSGASVPAGFDERFILTGILSDGSSRDLTERATWSSTNPAVATVSNTAGAKGVVTAVGAGNTQISAATDGHGGAVALTVTDATVTSLEVAPFASQVPAGYTQRFTCTATLSDGSTRDLTERATWTTTNPAVATVSNAAGSKGVVSGVSSGMTSVTAQSDGFLGGTTITISGASLQAIEVAPFKSKLPAAFDQRFTAVGTFSDGSTRDVTSRAIWTSTNAAIASVSNAAASKGVVTGVAGGTTQISASTGGVTGGTVLTVTGATLSAVEVSPPETSLGVRRTGQLTATGTFSDGSARDLSERATWTVSPPSLVSVSNTDGSRGQLTGVAPGVSQVTATVGSTAGSATITISGASFQAIEVSPPDSPLPSGITRPLTATATLSDGSTQDVTRDVTWTSSAPTIASVSNAAASKGLATPVSPGVTQITASYGGVAGGTHLTVTGAGFASVEIWSPRSNFSVSYPEQLRATATLTDGTTEDVTRFATWTSSAPAIAQVSNAAASKGVVTGVSPGMTQISATVGSAAGAAVLTLTGASLSAVDVSPPLADLHVGLTLPLRATGTFSDGSSRDITTHALWTSSTPSFVTVSNADGSRGQLTGVAPGTSQISATVDGVAGGAVLTIRGAAFSSIEVSPPGSQLASGVTRQLTATATLSDGRTEDVTRKVTWTSSAPTIASVSNAAASRGLVTPASPGTTQITAAYGGVAGGTLLTVTGAGFASLEIWSPRSNLAASYSEQLRAIATFSDGTTEDVTQRATWTSSSAGVASISNTGTLKGTVTGVAPGTTQISASTGGVAGGMLLTVTGATLSAIDVSPPRASLPSGFTRPLTATATFSDGTTADVTERAAWTSSTPASVHVSNADGTRGQLTGVAPGASQITASAGGVAGGAVITINGAAFEAIEVAPPGSQLPSGMTRQLTATATLSDGTTADVTERATWTSSAPTIASVSNAAGAKGRVTPAAPGTTQITAAYGAVAGGTLLTVTGASFASIEVSPFLSKLPASRTRQLTATATLSDGTTEDVTERATWTSTNPAVASISNAPSTQGHATGVMPGMTQIRATVGSVEGATVLTVTGSQLQAIEVTPPSSTRRVGNTQDYVATGIYADGLVDDMTRDVTWSSSSPAVVSISNAAASKGVATPMSVGSTQITASSGGVSGGTVLTISGASLLGIEVSPFDSTLPADFTRQLVATATFSDGRSEDVTDQVTWSSSDAPIASVSNAAATKGVARGVAPGMTQVTARAGATIGGTSLTISGSFLTSIDISPADSSLAPGFTRQLTATATLSDGSSMDVTEFVTWTTSDVAIAQVSNASGAPGRATAAAPGTVMVGAQLNGLAAVTTLTVPSATLSSIELFPVAPTFPPGFTKRFTAMGHFSDGSTQDVTDQVTWSTSNAAVAQVSNAAASRGEARTIAPGTADITASAAGISMSTTLTVSSAF